jgi:hypothetical protein
MQSLLRSGPLFLALGIALTGCTQSQPPPQKASQSPAKKESASTGPDVLPGMSEVVLTVEGMT